MLFDAPFVYATKFQLKQNQFMSMRWVLMIRKNESDFRSQLISLQCSNSNRRLTLTNNTLLTQTRLIMELCTASVTTWGAFTSPSFYFLSLLFFPNRNTCPLTYAVYQKDTMYT